MANKKVCIFSAQYLPHMGGVERYTLNLCKKLIENGNELTFIIKGNGFMRYMVRMIIGTIVMIGLHKENISFISEKLNSKNRNTVIYKALPNGLYLYKVFYKEDEQ